MKVWGALSGMATEVNCWVRPTPTLRVGGVTTVLTGTIFIGPSDLAAAFGHLGNPKHPEVQAAIRDAAARIRAAGKSAGFLTGNADDAEAFFDMGFNFTAVGSDVGILARNAESIAARFHKS